MGDGHPKNGRDEAAEQLNQFRDRQRGRVETLTTSSGSPIADKLNSLTIGPRGPTLLQDNVYIDEIAHFNRERIPERVVHAKGAGAFGYFEVTNDVTQYTRAKVFSEIGKRTPVAVRFSLSNGESGISDTSRELRGFAIKFYTEEGNWDLAGNNFPVCFIRDAIMLPLFVHSQKRNPVTHLLDPDMFWDYISLRAESTHQVTMLFADRGLPFGYRYLDGFGINTFKLVNAENEAVYCKFIYKTDQGIKNLSPEAARQLAGTDPDYAIRDLYDAIAKGDFPSWSFYIQVMTFEQARTWRFNPFDPTKVWPHSEFPLIEVGKFVLNRNPKNYFAEVEQIAFTVSNLVPGIEPSPDKVLQGRLFAYSDTQRYRLGTNYLQIPVNCPFRVRPRNYQRDGDMILYNQDGAPNYYPNSFAGPENDRTAREPPFEAFGDVDRYDSSNDDNFTQPGIFYREVLDDGQRDRLVRNIAENLVRAQEFIQARTVKNFTEADVDYGRRVADELKRLKEQGLGK